jgi:hypothetical protein
MSSQMTSRVGTSVARSRVNAAHCCCFEALVENIGVRASGTTRGIGVLRRSNVAWIARLRRSGSNS